MQREARRRGAGQAEARRAEREAQEASRRAQDEERRLAEARRDCEERRLAERKRLELLRIRPSAMSDDDLAEVVVAQSSNPPSVQRAMIAEVLALWIESSGEEEGRRTWRRSMEDICNRGRGVSVRLS